MGTVPVREKVVSEAEKTTRIAISGSASGSIRRPLLYSVAAIGIIVAMALGPVGVAVGMVALLLLAATDA